MTDYTELVARARDPRVWERHSLVGLLADAIELLVAERDELREFDKTKPDAEWRDIYDTQLKHTYYYKARAEKLEEAVHYANEENKRLLDLYKKAEAALKEQKDAR